MSERKLVGTGEMFKKALAGGYASRLSQKLLKKQDHLLFYRFQQVQENMLIKLI